MGKWQLLEFIFSLVDVGLVFYFTWTFLNRKNIIKKHVILVVFLQATVNLFINEIFGLASLYGVILLILSTGFFFRFILKESMLLMWLLIIFALIVNFIVEMSVVSLALFIIEKPPQIFYETTVFRLLGALLSKMIYFLIIRYFISKIRFDIRMKKSMIYQIYLLLVPNVIIIFLAIWVQRYIDIFPIKSTQYIMIITITVVLFTIGMLGIIKKIIEHTQKQIEWSIKEEEYMKQQFYIENIEDMIESLKAQRHDFNHHLSTIYGLIRLEHIDETKEYIEKLTNEINNFNHIVNTSNPVISSLLNIKANKGKKEGIDFNIKLDINGPIDIDGIDLSIIAGNLLDNAIEACKLIEHSKREIDIDMHIKENNLIIKIRNPKSEDIALTEKDLVPKFTSKEDSSNHGFGLSNVRNIVEKYNGIIKIDYNDKYFKVNIAYL